MVRRCLVKDARERPRDIGDLRRELSAIAQELSAPGGTRGAAGDTRPSLAVLYFENLTSDQESEYFCAGITEDILTDLSKIKGLRVASRNAVQRYRGGPADIPRVAADLGVGAVLEGSVRRAGDRVRISAQLINAAPDEVTFVKNTTEGIGWVANGLSWNTGDTVVTTNVEFPANVYPWMGLQSRGVRLKMIPEENGCVPVERIEIDSYGETRPAEKAALIARLQGQGRGVAMAGEDVFDPYKD